MERENVWEYTTSSPSHPPSFLSGVQVSVR